ncbi:MAG TPA: PAS domain S-box protein [Candidatus Saccharimonadales bacterium]|jgi:methyl-accepting chemotaxis protein|nr:PAS domain S-box protein [Candidatus Saccharimonadales bacterium]
MPVLTQPVRRTKTEGGRHNGKTTISAAEQRNLDYKGQIEALSKSQAVAEFQMDGTVLTANENFLRAVGYTLDEVIGRPHSMFVDANYRESPEYHEFWAALNRGEHQTGEYQRMGKGGREIWIHASYNPILDLNGRPFKVVAYATDATKQHKLLEEIEDLRVRAGITNMTSIVSESDLKGDIININEKFIEISKYSREELIGHPHSTTRHPDMPKETFKELWSTIGRGNTFHGIIKNRAKDGNPYYVDAVIAPVLGKNGKPKKYIGVRYDITAAETERQDMKGVIGAIDSTYYYVEYDTKGNVLKANGNFLQLSGYQFEEIRGKHERLFEDPLHANSDTYNKLWSDLSTGKARSDVFKKITKAGREIWVQAVYASIKDEMNRIYKYLEIGTDITAQRLANADYAGQVTAIAKSQAVIEFEMDGTIITANDNFLKVLGYTLAEVKGKHHSMFVDEDHRESQDYRLFWAKLNRGEYQSDEYKRIGKGGREAWIQASYNPILDLNGKPFKVVKFATDVTAQKVAAEELKRKVDSILIVVSAAAQGDLTRNITVSGNDAIGQMGEGLSGFLKDLRASMGKLAQNSQALSSSAEELSATSQEMSSNAEETSAQANVVSAGAEQVNSNLQTVATGTEEMSVTIKDIAKNATEAARVATTAVKVAEDTNQIVSKLGDSSTEIGQVIKVITSIAQQTNLLALNATIEAARAGEAGKGFAVVANEVKELAKQTAKATEDISSKIEAIQSDTKNAVDAIQQISGIIKQVNDISNTIATAVEEQNATTNEMARNVSEAARGSGEISKNIGGVADAAKSTTQGANDSLKAAQSLAQMSTELRELVQRFKI